MKPIAFVLILRTCLSLAEDCIPEHDDMSMLQTRAVAKDSRKKVPKVHRYYINFEEEEEEETTVTLLQGKRATPKQPDELPDTALPDGAVMWTVRPTDDSGVGEDTQDSYGSRYERGGAVEMYDESGEIKCTVTGFSPTSVSPEASFGFPESPDFCDSMPADGIVYVNTMDISSASEVFLIEIPSMDSKHFPKVQDEIHKAMLEFPDPRILFHGSGANSNPQSWWSPTYSPWTTATPWGLGSIWR